MPEHVLMSDMEIITDGGRRRRWGAAEILREALDKSRSKKQILHIRSPLREDFQSRWWPKPWVWPART